MSENVAVDGEATESPEPTEEPTTPPAEDVATIKKRLAGKDQALTRITKERDDAATELATLRKWKAEREEADMSEVDKLARRLAEAEARAAQAEASAERVRLERLYPDAVGLFGDDPLPNEDRLSALQERLASATEPGAAEPKEPRIDPNRPRRPASGRGKPIEDMEIDELTASLREQGNPFYDSVFG